MYRLDGESRMQELRGLLANFEVTTTEKWYPSKVMACWFLIWNKLSALSDGSVVVQTRKTRAFFTATIADKYERMTEAIVCDGKRDGSSKIFEPMAPVCNVILCYSSRRRRFRWKTERRRQKYTWSRAGAEHETSGGIAQTLPWNKPCGWQR